HDGFARIDLATRDGPVPGQVDAAGPFGEQDAPVTDEHDENVDGESVVLGHRVSLTVCDLAGSPVSQSWSGPNRVSSRARMRWPVSRMNVISSLVREPSRPFVLVVIWSAVRKPTRVTASGALLSA